MSKTVRYGIIGVGSQGGAYAMFMSGKDEFNGIKIPAGPKNSVLGALCDIDLEKEKMCRENYPDVPFYKDWKEMVLSNDVDAVITTVPHYLHTEIAIFCLEHGRNVLVEKPVGVYAKSVREMNECSLKHPEVAFGVMFNQRQNRLYQEIKQIIDSGDLGEIRRSNWIINSWWRPDCYYRQSAWRATWGGEGGGVTVNQAPHQLDLWQWLCGKPKSVYAKCRFGFERDIDVEDDVTVLAEYENGATGCFITCTHDCVGTDRLEIDMDGGKIVVDESKKATVYRLKKAEPILNKEYTMAETRKLMSGDPAAFADLYTVETFENQDGWGVQHIKVIENFTQHILEGTPLTAPGTDGLNEVNLANAILLSGWTKKEVELPVDEEEYLAELNRRIEQEGKFETRK